MYEIRKNNEKNTYFKNAIVWLRKKNGVKMQTF